MPVIYFAGEAYTLEDGENLLNGLLRQQVRIPYSCRAGVCHSCLMKLDQGKPPENSQHGLNQLQRSKQCFLACQSFVQNDLQISFPVRDEIPARVINIVTVTTTEILLTVSTRFPFNGASGDEVLILTQSGIQSQLPIKAISQGQNTIEFVIKRKAGDEFSRWVHESLEAGDALMIVRHSEKIS